MSRAAVAVSMRSSRRRRSIIISSIQAGSTGGTEFSPAALSSAGAGEKP